MIDCGTHRRQRRRRSTPARFNAGCCTRFCVVFVCVCFLRKFMFAHTLFPVRLGGARRRTHALPCVDTFIHFITEALQFNVRSRITSRKLLPLLLLVASHKHRARTCFLCMCVRVCLSHCCAGVTLFFLYAKINT